MLTLNLPQAVWLAVEIRKSGEMSRCRKLTEVGMGIMKIKLGKKKKKMVFQYIEKRIESTADQEIPSSNPILIFTYELISPTCHSAILSPWLSIRAILLWFLSPVSVHQDQVIVQCGFIYI